MNRPDPPAVSWVGAAPLGFRPRPKPREPTDNATRP